MSADTTPVILITNGKRGLEYRVAVAQAWENAWRDDDEGRVLDSRYVVITFAGSPVVVSTIEDARKALSAYIVSRGWGIQYDEQVLNLAVTRPPTDLERYVGAIPTFTFEDLVRQAEQWQALDTSSRRA
jgi:hypothetical protein